MLRPVYTEPENCQDCYKCIRECPVKAIRVESNKASIIEQRCIYCGHCTQVCPTGAKKVRDGLTRARMTLAKHTGKVYLSLAPSYVSEFSDVDPAKLVAAIKELGFEGVSETALGAEIVSAMTDKFLSDSPAGIYLSSACPVVVDYVRKYAVDHIPNITPIVSPMIAHARILRECYGDDIKIIFAGPCISKKSEADTYRDLIDVAITFRDLRTWLEQEGLEIETAAPDAREKVAATADPGFIPYASRTGALYPIEGGMLSGLRKTTNPVSYMAFSGITTIKELLGELSVQAPRGDTIFLELLACKGGCINGPAKVSSGSMALKRYDIVSRCKVGDPAKDFSHIDLGVDFEADEQRNSYAFSEKEIKQALASISKTTAQDELNCSSCGYDSCRDFAVAMLAGLAEDNMCASYMRKIAHDKATVLLQKIPAGVILVNSDLKVVDMNRAFAAAMGEDTLGVYELCPGMAGAAVSKLCGFESFFRTVLATGEEIRERQVNQGDRSWILSIYNIQPHRLVFGLLQDLREPSVRKEWMLDKTRNVIRNHMYTVQKVAELLGENAAYTDATLRSIIEAYDNEKPESKK